MNKLTEMVKRSPNFTSRHPQNRNRVKTLFVIAVLLSGAGLAMGGIWLSLQLFINPNAVSWINLLLPNWAKIPTNKDSSQTLTEIKASLSQQGQIVGELLTLETDLQTLQPKSLLLPVLNQQPQCQNDCKQIVELRLYQLSSTDTLPQDKAYYQLVSKFPVEGPEESLVIAPLVDAETSDYGSTSPLPLKSLHRYTGNVPTSGVWLYLVGHRLQGSTAIAYGQVIHYNPSRSHLSLMLQWTSPTGQVPQWQQITGDSSPELVVNQTVDLEPQLRVYQVKPAAFFLNPIQLETISLLKPALNDSAYQQAIFIARNGLWFPAWRWLQFIKQQQRETWSASAQAQMDLIQLYAQDTHKQAEKTWASPSQQALADIIDGRWGEALQVFQASTENTQEIAYLLQADSGQIWQRVEAALRVNPDRPEVKAWGALILTTQQGKAEAIAWLQQQPKTTPTTVNYIQPLLRRLEPHLF